MRICIIAAPREGRGDWRMLMHYDDCLVRFYPNSRRSSPGRASSRRLTPRLSVDVWRLSVSGAYAAFAGLDWH